MTKWQTPNRRVHLKKFYASFYLPEMSKSITKTALASEKLKKDLKKACLNGIELTPSHFDKVNNELAFPFLQLLFRFSFNLPIIIRAENPEAKESSKRTDRSVIKAWKKDK